MKRLLLPIAVISLLSVFVVSALTPYGAATSPDSIWYLDMASHFAKGDGMVATDFEIENIRSPRAVVEKRLWPPLYPALIAVASFGEPGANSVSILSMLLLSLTGVMIYLVLSTQLRGGVAVMASLAFCLSLPVVVVFTYAWSETLFMALLTVAVWASVRYVSGGSMGRGALVVFFVALALLVYTRYIGIVYGLMIPLLFLMAPGSKRDAKRFVSLSVAYALLVAYPFVDNYLVAGSFSGGERGLSERGGVENVIDVVGTLIAFFPGSSMEWGLIGLLVAVGGVALRRGGIWRSTGDRAIGVYLFRAPLVMAGGYLVSLVVMRTSTSFDAIDVRLLSPIVPLMWISLAVAPTLIRGSGVLSGVGRAVPVALLIAVSLNGLGQIGNALIAWDRFGKPMHPMGNGLVYLNYTFEDEANTKRRVLRNIVGEGGVIATSRPSLVNYVTGIRAVRLPGEITMETVDVLNRLPEGSLLVLDQEEQLAALGKLSDAGKIIYQYAQLEDLFLVGLPIATGAD